MAGEDIMDRRVDSWTSEEEEEMPALEEEES